jgi:hypothetical protein
MSERVTTARVRELRDAATPGPWLVYDSAEPLVLIEAQCVDEPGSHIVVAEVHPGPSANAALIAAAPDLAADLLEAREEIARLRETADFWQRQHGVAVLVRDGDIAAWKGEAARLRAIVESATRRELVAVDYVAG